MRGKVIYRIAAGTCSVCITYSLIMQAIHGESPSQAAAEVWAVTPTAMTAQVQPTVVPQTEYPSDTWQMPGNSWYSSSRGGKRGRQQGGRDRHGKDSFDGYTDSYGSSGYDGGQAPGSTDEEKERAGITDPQDQQDSENSSQSAASGDPPTLQQYLSLLRCSGCRHNCCLLSPRCMKGRTKQKNATVQYQTTYGG